MQKQNLTQLALCVVTSILASLISVGIVFHRPMPITQTATQTVSVNQVPEPPTVNINTASRNELMHLDGIGETLADRIIEHRPYTDKWQVADIPGIGGQTLKKIIDRIEVTDP